MVNAREFEPLNAIQWDHLSNSTGLKIGLTETGLVIAIIFEVDSNSRMHIDMAVACVILAAILGCLVAFPVWVVKSFKESNSELRDKLEVLTAELTDSKVKRHEQAVRIIFLSDKIDKLANEFEKLRDKMEQHIENSDCRKR